MKRYLAQITSFFLHNYSLILLFIVSTIICYQNYTPNTFLTGWDTLHPEFNFNIYWSRILNGAWQSHQGLGAVATQAHASEIPRIVILMFLDLFLKMNQLRYAYAFLMIILGPLGVFLFMKDRVLKSYGLHVANIGAFASGLFYILNLGTLQHFYVPLEMFLTHFGFFGFIMLFATRFFEEGRRKDLLLFVIFSLLIAPQAHTSTLFYSYVLGLSVYLGSLTIYSIFQKNFKTSLSRFGILLALTFIVNLFWFLPNLYFAINHGKEIQNSKIHELFSEEAFLQNKAFGKIEDISILRNFLFNWGGYIGGGQFGDLMPEWKSHLQGLPLYFGYGMFVLILIGLLISIITKHKIGIGNLAVFLLSLFFLLNVNPPTGAIFSWLQENLPLFKEAFRFPFTKFDTLAAFSYAVFYGIFWAFVLSKFAQILRSKILISLCYVVFYLFIVSSSVYFMLPAFKGFFISPKMRVEIPQRYFEMFSYFDSQNEYGRVADLPIHSFWGWSYYNWDPKTEIGYQGAGFLWFGIKQPLMNREFDRWNLTNEQYYTEMTKAIYSEDVNALELVLEKYNIRWLLLDTSVIAPGSDPKVLFYPQIIKLLDSSNKIKLAKNFGNGLFVYKYTPTNDFSYTVLLKNIPNISNFASKEYDDPMYADFSTYVNSGEQLYPYVGITYPDESLKSSMIRSDTGAIYFDNPMSLSLMTFTKKNISLQYNILASFKDPNSLHLEFQPYSFETLSNSSIDIPLQNIDKDAELLFNIQDNLVPLTLARVTSQPMLLKTIYLKLNDELPVILLKGENLQLNKIDSSGIEACSAVIAGASYSAEPLKNGTRLYAKSLTSCITNNIIDLIPSGKLKSATFGLSLNIESLAKADVCILDESTGLCFNTPIIASHTFFNLDASKLSTYDLRFVLDGKLYTTPVFADFTNVQLLQYLPVGSYKVTNISANLKLDSLYLNSVKIKKDSSTGGFATKLIDYPRVCNTGSREFEGSKITNAGDYLRYQSTDVSLCDSFPFPGVAHSTGYLLEVRARNIYGVPLRICVTNEYSKRCDIYVSLTDSAEFETQYFVIPPMDKEKGYTVNISNLVFGGTSSINDLAYLNLSPIPYSFLRNLSIAHNTVSTSPNLFILNQAYESGWLLFDKSYNLMPKHVQVNGWANGWPVDTPEATSSYKLVFWPQVLEYAGLLLVGSLLLVVVTLLIKLPKLLPPRTL